MNDVQEPRNIPDNKPLYELNDTLNIIADRLGKINLTLMNIKDIIDEREQERR